MMKVHVIGSGWVDSSRHLISLIMFLFLGIDLNHLSIILILEIKKQTNVYSVNDRLMVVNAINLNCQFEG